LRFGYEFRSNTFLKEERGCEMKVRASVVLIGIVFSSFALYAQNSSHPDPRATQRIEKEVRHELNMLPYVTVFDYLAYKVDGYDVTLIGQVTRPTTKSDAEAAVKRIEGVERVDNQIEVLPLSPMDDRLRVRLFRAIYGYPPLQKYAVGINKPIRIIVKNGHVTLEGIVDNMADKNVAGIRANGVPGVFSVDNKLQVEK
jgi:hyperosmotically inducible protein